MGSTSMPDKEMSSNPGKTSPRLLVDLEIYDFRNPNTNTLIDFPAHYHTTKPPLSEFPAPTHHHTLVTKPEQSENVSSTTPDTEKTYVVATMCKQCRIHFDVLVEYPRGLGTTLCGFGNHNNPLHHFQYLKTHSGSLHGKDVPGSREEQDRRVFRCSSEKCATTLAITSKPPMLDADDLRVMSDTSLFRARAKKVSQTVDPDKAHPLLPLDALKALHSYISGALSGMDKPIPVNNTRLLHTLGSDAEKIFRKAHFQLDATPENEKWMPPFLREEVETDLEDLVTELKALSLSTPFRGSGLLYNPTSAVKELQRLLACEEYETTHQQRSSKPHDYIPRYANLGAIGDFSDDLINWCYRRQITVDPLNAPYYLECLMDLATGRNSESLQMAVATSKSEGHFSVSDVRDAYRALNLDPDVELETDVIIGKFRAFVSDSPRSEPQMRQALLMIGTARNCQAIIQAASKAPMDVKQAHEYFDVTPGIDPAFLITLYQLKVKDQPNQEGAAKDALRLIANEISSAILTEFLESGNIYEQPMDVSTAYARLGAAEHIPDDSLIALYDIRLSEGVNINDYREALKIIGECRNSEVIRNYLQTGELSTGAVHSAAMASGREDWPVGLCNIGNTCYLNSLLQFYFTIKPLRDMVLNFDLYQEDLNEAILRTKRVGGRIVTVKEVERAKIFVGHLQTLFRSMISSKDSSVRPEKGLAELALGSKEEAKETEEKKLASTDVPNPILTLDDDLDTKMEDDTGENLQNIDDAGSEITLVEKVDTKANDEDFVMIDSDKKGDSSFEDKENLPPRTESMTVNGVRPVLQDINIDESQQLPALAPQAPPTPPPETPDCPPPIPPRPSPKPEEKNTDYMFNRQQDVAECIENVMFQLEAAVKPEDHDESGEQIDLIKKLFYGKTKQSLQLVGSTERRSKFELFSHLLIDVADGNRDIYSALDNVFDVTTVNLEGKDTIRYLSISELPPVLQLQVQRVQFDRKSGKAYKSTAYLKFPETIYMDRYLDSNDPVLEAKREEAWVWKTEIAALEKRKAGLTNTSVDLEAPEALMAVRSWINEVNSSEDKDLLEEAALSELLNGLDEGIKTSTQELNGINEQLEELQAKAAAQFEGLHDHGYRIHSVFMHRGSATFGHYWIYIYDFAEKIWRKYNDEYVSQVTNTKEVFEHLDAVNPATPYFLVFVKEDETQRDMVEAVERKFEQSSSG